jgi:hypothetical protein
MSFISYEEAKNACIQLNLSAFKKTTVVDSSKGGGNAKFLKCSDSNCKYAVQIRKSINNSIISWKVWIEDGCRHSDVCSSCASVMKASQGAYDK